MAAGLGGGGGQEDLPAPSPSPRVELEAALLASEPVAEGLHAPGERVASRTRLVIILSANPDTRYYLRECLRLRPYVRVVEAMLPAVVEMLVRHLAPDLLIVDGEEREIRAKVPTILLADERPFPTDELGAMQGRQVWLARPFNAGSLMALVDRMLETDFLEAR